MNRLRLAAAVAVTALLVAGLAPAASAGNTSTGWIFGVVSPGAEVRYGYTRWGGVVLNVYDRAKDGHSALGILKVKKNGVYTEVTRMRNSGGNNTYAERSIASKPAKGTQMALVSCRVDMDSADINERYGHDCKTVYFTML